MSDQENINRVQAFVNELNQGNMATVQSYIADEFFAHVPVDDEPMGTEVYGDFARDLRAAFSDLSVSIENLVAEDDVLRGQMTLAGTHDGTLWRAPASGKRVSWTVDVVLRVTDDGRFAPALENITVPQLLGLLRQVDLINPPDQMDKPGKYPVTIPEILFKVLFTGQVADKACSHLAQIQVTEPATDVCEDCVVKGDIWPALRMCLICGYVGCCDTSVNTHAKKHYQATGHSLFHFIHLAEGWIWCYEDNALFTSRVLNKYRQ